MLKDKWKYSALRFYVLNTIWNYKFWLNAKKVFEVTTQTKKDRFGIVESTTVKKRFKGYLYRYRILIKKDKVYIIKYLQKIINIL